MFGLIDRLSRPLLRALDPEDAHNLTLKVEYLYTDLGTFHHDLGALIGAPAGFVDASTRTQFSTVRAGVNWKFDWLAPALPVVAKY